MSNYHNHGSRIENLEEGLFSYKNLQAAKLVTGLVTGLATVFASGFVIGREYENKEYSNKNEIQERIKLDDGRTITPLFVDNKHGYLVVSDGQGEISRIYRIEKVVTTERIDITTGKRTGEKKVCMHGTEYKVGVEGKTRLEIMDLLTGEEIWKKEVYVKGIEYELKVIGKTKLGLEGIE